MVSMVMDHYWDKWQPIQPQIQPFLPYPTAPAVTPEEIDEFRKLLDRARDYDRKKQPTGL